jgi:glycerol-3-phosphate acyltransferase PlsY
VGGSNEAKGRAGGSKRIQSDIDRFDGCINVTNMRPGNREDKDERPELSSCRPAPLFLLSAYLHLKLMGLPATISVIVCCYALGCVLPSYYAVKWKTGKDLRETGSGNAGATNAGRLLGKPAYVVLSLLDIFKGWAACAGAVYFGLDGWWLAGAGLAVVAGHLWPAQLGFRGGKGLSSAYGVLIYAAPWVALLMWAVLIMSWLAMRSMTLGVVQAFLSAPLLALAMHAEMPVTVLCFVLALVIALSHRRNIRDALQRRRERAHPTTESSAA